MLRRNGSHFTANEICEALRECANDLGRVPTFSAYLRWAASEEVRLRGGRRPRSQAPFDRVAGGWSGALEQAGLLASSGVGPVNPVGTYRPAAYRFTPEQMRAALREAAGELGRSPRTTEYARLRDELHRREEQSGGQVIARPSYQVFHRAYGSWDDALIDAVLDPLGGRNTPGAPRTPSVQWSETEVWDALLRCAECHDGRVGARMYQAWRNGLDVRESVPSYETILARLSERVGPWKIIAAEVRRRYEAGERDSTPPTGTASTTSVNP